MKYPPAWQRLFTEHQPDIDSGNFAIYNPQDKQNEKRTLATIFKVSTSTSKKITEILQKEVPAGVKSKIFFQPYQGFHFTIQWAPEKCLPQINLEDLLLRLKKTLKKFPPINGDLSIPFFGRAGLYGLLKTESNNEIFRIRKEVDHLWRKIGLPLGLNPKDYDLAYISTARYLQPFDLGEVEELKKIQTQQIPHVLLTEIWIVLNDKFMIPEKTQVIDKIVLFN